MRSKLLAACLLFCGFSAFAADEASEAQKREIDKILELPAFSIKRMAPSDQASKEEQIAIGDAVSFELTPDGIDLTGVQQLEWHLLPGSSPLFEQGWMGVGAPVYQAGKIKFRMVPLQAGDVSLPQLVLRGIQDGEAKDILRTDPLNLSVLHAIDPQDPRNQTPPAAFYPPARVPMPAMGYVSAGSLLVLLIVASIMAFRYWRRSKRRQPIAYVRPEPRKKSEDVVALTDLMRMEALKLHEKNEFKGLYFGVSEILKTYLGRRYDFDALESTSDELFAQLQTLGVNALALERLVSLFSKLDRVKFTDQEPEVKEAEAIIHLARDIVSLTKRTSVGITVNSQPTLGEATNAV